MATPAIGQQAPDFTLPGITLSGEDVTTGEFTLSQEKGHPVVLAFYPGDNTPVCTRQMCSYAEGIEAFRELGAMVWGISPQGLDSHEGFARKHSLGFPLLADTDRAVVKKYGIAMPGLGLRRSVFIVDADGVLRWKQVGLLGVTYSDVDTIAKQLAKL